MGRWSCDSHVTGQATAGGWSCDSHVIGQATAGGSLVM